MDENYIGKALDELYRIFDLLNKEYFKGRLLYPMLTIQSTKKKVLGWCSFNKVWTSQPPETADSRYEITICTHHLQSPILDIVETLHHELVHLVNCMDNIKDCSDSQHHNKKFKVAAEKVDLICEKSTKYGWGITTPSAKFREFIETVVKPNAEVFKYFKEQEIKLPAKLPVKKVFKYICPDCQLEAKGRKDIRVVCQNCNKLLIMEDLVVKVGKALFTIKEK